MTQGVAYVGERRRLLEVREDGQKYRQIYSDQVGKVDGLCFLYEVGRQEKRSEVIEKES